jgi:hypothetical protein
MRQWKVGTITMGALLVTLGIVSIMSQSSGAPLIDAVLKWWPIALIILGIEVLLSSFFSRGDHVRIKFDGFSIFLILLILLITTGAYFVQNVINGGIAGQIINFNYPSKYETKVSKNYSIAAEDRKKLILNNSLGDVIVQKSTSGKIEIEAKVNIRNNDEEYAKSIIDSLIKIDENSIVKVESTTSSSLSDKYKVQGISIHYTVKIPSNIDIEIDNKFGKVNAEELVNNIKISNSNGDILLRDIEGYGKVSNKFGRIELFNIRKKIEINNSNGTIYLDNDRTSEEDIFIQNKFGQITLKLPEAQQGNFKCDTRFGKITSNFMLNIVEEHGNNQSASGTIGKSNVNIKIDNSNGNINLLKR